MKNWNDIGFTIEYTADKSPSLRLLASLNPAFETGEAMHHSGGAATETQMIYGEAIEIVFQQVNPARFMVVGLGLGYIEMFIGAYAVLLNKKIEQIISYESVPELREAFWCWLHRLPLSEPIQKTYDEVWSSIYQQLRSRFGETMPDILSSSEDLQDEVVKQLQQHFPEVNSINGEIHPSTRVVRPVHGVMYDAFSSKTTPHLWEEEFLFEFLGAACAADSLVVTYAAKGTLKAALRRLDFFVGKRDGFKSKRGSTRASRGKFLPPKGEISLSPSP